MEPIMISDTELKTTKIGFVGLGHMGGNMAARFLAGGYTIYGESRDRRHAQDLEHEELNWRHTARGHGRGRRRLHLRRR
jgi:predicted dinucleotide-binding enzyme